MLMEANILHCRERLVEEERLAEEAPSTEAAMVHSQLAMLYRAQLDALKRQQRDILGVPRN